MQLQGGLVVVSYLQTCISLLTAQIQQGTWLGSSSSNFDHDSLAVSGGSSNDKNNSGTVNNKIRVVGDAVIEEDPQRSLTGSLGSLLSHLRLEGSDVFRSPLISFSASSHRWRGCRKLTLHCAFSTSPSTFGSNYASYRTFGYW